MRSELRFYDLDLTHLPFEGCLFKLRHHVAGPKESQVTALRARERVGRDLSGQKTEAGLAGPDALQKAVGHLTALRRIGIGDGAQQNMACPYRIGPGSRVEKFRHFVGAILKIRSVNGTRFGIE